MKKILAILAIACAAVAADVARVDASADAAAKLAEYEKACAIIVQQRNALSAQLLDMQAQAQLLAAEVETLRKQLAETQAKLASASKPKPDAQSKSP